MRSKADTHSEEAEKAVRDIRRATRRQYSAEEKVRIVIAGLRGEDSIAELCPRRASTRTSIIAGRRTSWRRARSGCGFSILDPLGFIGGLDRLRIDFVQGDAGKRPSLLCGSNSLLRRNNSLFLQNNSLFG
jgi:hypothetical protein